MKMKVSNSESFENTVTCFAYKSNPRNDVWTSGAANDQSDVAGVRVGNDQWRHGRGWTLASPNGIKRGGDHLEIIWKVRIRRKVVHLVVENYSSRW